MIQKESAPARTTVMVQGKMVTLPKWLEEEASTHGLEKAKQVVEAERKLINYHVVNNLITANVKGSKGDTYLVKVSIWNRENGEKPTLLTCNCPHGVYGGRGICYHKIAVILKVLLLPFMPASHPLPKYEDDFKLD